MKLTLDVLGLALFLGFFGLIAWHSWGVVEQSWTSGSRSQSALETPTVVPQLLWFAGLVGFLLVGLLVLAHTLALAFRGDPAHASRVIGTRSAAEDVAEEVTDLRRRAELGGPG